MKSMRLVRALGVRSCQSIPDLGVFRLRFQDAGGVEKSCAVSLKKYPCSRRETSNENSCSVAPPTITFRTPDARCHLFVSKPTDVSATAGRLESLGR